MNERISLDGKLKEAYGILSSVAAEAYKDVYLLSNQVLSKNPLTSSFLKNYLSGSDFAKPGIGTVICKLFRYYLGSVRDYIAHLVKSAIYFTSGPEYHPQNPQDELVLIDTVFLSQKIVSLEKYSDSYFKGLDEVLCESGREYAYLPVFYNNKDTRTFRSALKIIRRDRIPVLSEFQLLTFSDRLRMLAFLVAYPWHVLHFAKTLNENDQKTKLVYHELINTLDQVTFPDYSRYLQGKRISELPYKSIKLISWYENQVIDKNLYKGVREKPGKVVIYGAQLFRYLGPDLNIIADENETVFNIVPDRILVNGPYLIPESSSLNYAVGPSLRYKKQFEPLDHEKDKEKNDILVLLSYSTPDTENINADTKDVLEILRQADLSGWHVVIKPHPAAPIDKYLGLIHNCGWDIRNDELYKLFASARIVIGSASGSLFEALSLCIPVIVVNPSNSFYTVLPEMGKDILWNEVSCAGELQKAVERFSKYQQDSIPEMNEIALWYKKAFFNEPTKENIIKAFDL
jgi:hypothetical protein